METSEAAIFKAVLIASGIIGIIILYFIISIIRQHRRHQSLYREKIELEISTLERERARIAADLHDQLGPILSAAKLKLGSIEGVAENHEKLINDSVGYIDNVIIHVREIANNLMPNSLSSRGLIAAIEEIAYQVSSSSSLEISIHHHHVPDYSVSDVIHLFRILQEIIHNTVKHSNATKLVIEFYRVKNKFVISTADNGRGFDQDSLYAEQIGRGLHNLRSRADILNAELTMRSKPGMGTSYLIEIPIRVD